MSFKLLTDSNWTLFLDRDGVINRRIFGGYVLETEQFEFLPGVLDSLAFLSTIFGKIIVVTNQQGIAKGYMTEQQLLQIHDKMQKEVSNHGGRIDAVFVAKEFKNTEPFHRKPNRAMGLMAKQAFPEIDFEKSIMVGDTDTDILFGQNLGMKTVLVKSLEKTTIHPDFTISNFTDLCDIFS